MLVWIGKNRALFLRLWLPVIAWMGLIYLFSSMPGSKLPKVDIPNIDKIVHFLEYFIFSLLLMRALVNSTKSFNLTALIILSIMITSLYGISDEWHQSFVAGRMSDLYDYLTDSIGSITGAFLYMYMHVYEKIT
ncbi:MAG: VanZ family protein [Candidatus Omnitrophica bacterium]|nr:VanZ family protein [Candidatus Omnitrophota bacterium]